MKIRHGFVSNSSSSSFVIGVPHGTELTEEAFHLALYGTKDVIKFAPYYDCGDPDSDAVRAILRQITTDHDKEELSDVINVDFDRNPYRTKPNREYDWDAIDAEYKRRKDEEAKRLMESMKNQDIYIVCFSDNDGEAALEHGDALNSLDSVVRYSHH